MRRRLLPLLLGSALAGPLAAQGLELSLPAAAVSTAQEDSAPDTFALPIGPYADGELPVIATEGRVLRQAWRIPSQGLTTQQLMAPLKEQALAAGFQPILDCEAQGCGGFDFRHAAEVLEAPAMHVDLFDYRVFTAGRGDGDEAAHLMLLVSRSSAAGYVQLVLITPDDTPGLSLLPAPAAPADAPGAADATPLAQALERQGHVVLPDLDFGTGSSELTDLGYASLAELARYLRDNPDRRVALVGHTDTEGALDGNIALSRLRAQSVMTRLVEKHGVAQGQLDAEGMGYLAPIDSNLTPEGRERNRRVEAVLLNGP
ncbi:OmpA family protein [Pseudooceanicola sp. LIPI14-2-Ac024]|uniref:OmpA family protein n=1 Tax=Pseudooceanicola sp. LIPI14-2-Ac024 TaxID=3344875 RepID=UPI0035D08E48